MLRTVPFHLSEAYGGFADLNGRVRVEGEELVFEFQLQDAFFGAVKSGVKELRLSFDDLEEVSYRKKLWSRSLLVRTRGLAPLADLPGADAGEVILKIAKKDESPAKDLASYIGMLVSERNLQRMEEQARDVDRLPDAES